MRAAALGARERELPEVADLWQRLRSHTGQETTVVPSGTIAQVVISLASATLEPGSEPQSDEPNQWFRSFLAHGGNSVMPQIVNAFGSLSTESLAERFTGRTAEERVVLLDEFAPLLSANPAKSRIEKAFAVALIAFLCRPGFSQQAMLLAPYSTALPECMLWLGALQAVVPFTETLASGDGLGWRLARDLFEPDDLFSVPKCDIALSELQVLARGKNSIKTIKSPNRLRLDVELLPRVSVFVRSVQTGISDQAALPLEPQSLGAVAESQYQRNRNSISIELLSDAEKAVAALSRFIRNARIDPRVERAAGSKRRR
jgi:hypothetical protein